MTEPTSHRTVAGMRTAFPAALVFVLAACTAGAGDLGSLPPPPGSSGPSAAVPTTQPTSSATEPVVSPSASPTPAAARVYFLLGSFTGDGGLVPVARAAATPMGNESAIVAALLAGPNDSELAARPAMYTAIPSGTTLLAQVFEGGSAVSTVNLSREFTTGGDPATIVQRYAQIVFTVSQRDATTRVRFQIDGVDAPAVLSSGPVNRAVTRVDYFDQLPAIWVELPVWGGTLRSGARVLGLADVFEAQFTLQIVDSTGHVLADTPVMASCGTGCVGTFEARPTYEVATAQWGTLRVFEPSAKDGSPTHVVEYPVWLMP